MGFEVLGLWVGVKGLGFEMYNRFQASGLGIGVRV